MTLTVPETKRTTSYTELLVREYFKFFLPEEPVEYNVRPDWIKNTFTGKNLELDIFYPTLGLAIEVNGILHKGKYQSFKDDIKNRECKKKGIKLFTVYNINYLFSDNAKSELGRITGRFFGTKIPHSLHRRMVFQSNRKYSRQSKKAINKKMFGTDRWFKTQKNNLKYRNMVDKEREGNLARMKAKGLL